MVHDFLQNFNQKTLSFGFYAIYVKIHDMCFRKVDKHLLGLTSQYIIGLILRIRLANRKVGVNHLVAESATKCFYKQYTQNNRVYILHHIKNR